MQRGLLGICKPQRRFFFFFLKSSRPQLSSQAIWTCKTECVLAACACSLNHGSAALLAADVAAIFRMLRVVNLHPDCAWVNCFFFGSFAFSPALAQRGTCRNIRTALSSGKEQKPDSSTHAPARGSSWEPPGPTPAIHYIATASMGPSSCQQAPCGHPC